MNFSSDDEFLVMANIIEKAEKREKKRLSVHNINIKREEYIISYTIPRPFLERSKMFQIFSNEFTTFF